MDHRGRWWLVAATLLFSIVGCGSDDVEPAAQPPLSLDERAAVETFARYWDEAVAIANAGRVPQDAFATTATGLLREDEIDRLTRDTEAGATRAGAPEFKHYRATVSGDAAVVVACINEDGWTYSVPGREPVRPDSGWRTLGRELTRIDGEWRVSDYSPESSRDSCD